MFTKTFQGFYVEKPIVNLVCKLIFEVNDSVENFKQVKLRKSIAEEETKGIDYIYEDGSLILNFQVKSGESDASFLRKTSHAISKLPNDVYCCIYTKKEDGKIKLTVKYNDAILLNV
jgi:hypothetical protein